MYILLRVMGWIVLIRMYIVVCVMRKVNGMILLVRERVRIGLIQ